MNSEQTGGQLKTARRSGGFREQVFHRGGAIMARCLECDGTGKIDSESGCLGMCINCYGSGTIGWHSGDHACRQCEGTGHMGGWSNYPACRACCGSGLKYDPNRHTQPIIPHSHPTSSEPCRKKSDKVPSRRRTGGEKRIAAGGIATAQMMLRICANYPYRR